MEAKREDFTVQLPVNTQTGFVQITTGFMPFYAAIINTSAATVWLAKGSLLSRPNGAIPVESGNYLSFDIESGGNYTLFYEAPGFLGDQNNQLVVRLSTMSLVMQGGSLDGSEVVGKTEIEGIVQTNIAGVVDTRLDEPIPAGTNLIGRVTVENPVEEVEVSNFPTSFNVGNFPAKTDVEIVDPLPAGTNLIGKVEVANMPPETTKQYTYTIESMLVDSSTPIIFPTTVPANTSSVLIRNRITNSDNTVISVDISTNMGGSRFHLGKGDALKLSPLVGNEFSFGRDGDDGWIELIFEIEV